MADEETKLDVNDITLYRAEKTPSKFHQDDSLVRGMMGPIGSGKSVCMCQELLFRAMRQLPNKNGIRQTKWAVIRNTYRELTDTTIQTWHQWYPKTMGSWKQMSLEHHFRIPGYTFDFKTGEYALDGTIVEFIVIFRALDKPDDIRKLLSLEVTGGWINEAREIPRAILTNFVGRTGRYPKKDDLSGFDGASWRGVFMDTNPPDDDHWWYELFEELKPKKYKLFKQPSGLSKNAENKQNLPKSYYEDMLLGNNKEWINVYVHGKYGHIEDGMPIYPEFNDDVHVADKEIKFSKELDLWVGLDFGRTPSAEFAQQGPDGQWRFIDEITTENMGALEFSKLLGGKLRRDYRGCTLHIYGDPAGDDRGQTDDRTPYDVLRIAGIDVLKSPSQDPIIRREAMANQMTQQTFTGNSMLLVSPKCRMLRKGLNGGYKYRRMQVSGEDRYENKPLKNRFSHPVEAAEYLLVGAGMDVTRIGNEVNWDNLNRKALDKAAG